MMGLDIAKKGDRLDITKGRNIKRLKAVLDWKAQAAPGYPDFDLDVAVFSKDENDKVGSTDDVLFYNSPQNPDGTLSIYNQAIVHSGDERKGDKEEDEVVTFDLEKLPSNKKTFSVVVHIYDCVKNNQTFGQVKDARVRLYDADTNEQLLVFDMTEDFSGFTSLHAFDIYRHGSEFKFNAKSEGKVHADLNGFFDEWTR